MKHRIIAARVVIQASLAAALWAASSLLGVPLLWIIGAGLVTALVAGKVFCRWACPIGLVMEFLFRGAGRDSLQGQYLYYKAGCPIAWLGGFLNRHSPFRIRRDEAACVDCGACDRACYIATLDKGTSIHRAGKERPQDAFACSRCLKCVAACPNGSLAFRAEPFTRA